MARPKLGCGPRNESKSTLIVHKSGILRTNGAPSTAHQSHEHLQPAHAPLGALLDLDWRPLPNNGTTSELSPVPPPLFDDLMVVRNIACLPQPCFKSMHSHRPGRSRKLTIVRSRNYPEHHVCRKSGHALIGVAPSRRTNRDAWQQLRLLRHVEATHIGPRNMLAPYIIVVRVEVHCLRGDVPQSVKW